MEPETKARGDRQSPKAAMDRRASETAGVLKEVVGGGSEEASAPLLLAHPCSFLLQLLLRACAGCLGLHGYCSDDDGPKQAADNDDYPKPAADDDDDPKPAADDDDDPKPAADDDDDAAPPAVAETPKEGAGGAGGDEAASEGGARVSKKPPSTGPPAEGGGGGGGEHH